MDAHFDFAPATKKARIEIIPLIDVIFFLLATFVLFTLSLDKILAIEVVLPKAPPPGSMSDPPDNTLYLQASEQGTYYWKVGRDAPAEMVMRDDLRARLANYARSPNPRVFVRSDRGAKYGDAIFALDQVRAVEITQVSVETLTGPTGR
jgi:biopolymer transport protein ExbD